MISVLAGRWEGLEGLGESALMELVPGVAEVIQRAGRYAVNETKKTLSGPRSGRVYKVSRTGRLHVAAAPGEPPAVLFDRLRQSIAFTFRWDGLTAIVEIGSNVVYAAIQEWGGITSRGVRIPAHPYFEPTMLRVEPVIDQMFENFDVGIGQRQVQRNLESALFGSGE
jgi:phage gpG-like protein